jgi:hypothetical protein
VTDSITIALLTGFFLPKSGVIRTFSEETIVYKGHRA